MVSQLSGPDLCRLASIGIRTRKIRAALSALGIAVGVAAIVAVMGLSASSQASLLAQIDALGTNMLTVTNGQSFTGEQVELPRAAPGMVSRIGPVTSAQSTGAIIVNAYRTPYVPPTQSNSLAVQAADLGLLQTVGTELAAGTWLNKATATKPVVVLGSVAAQRLGISRITPGLRIWVGTQWFYVTGILKPAALAPAIDSSVLMGYPAAAAYLNHDGHPSTIYVRANPDQVEAVGDVLAQTANPESPSDVSVSRPSDALVARAHAKSAMDSLFLALGAISLIVGAIGVANIMIIGVLERRTEIGLRRALGATRNHIRLQFMAEALLLCLLGGISGVAFGAIAVAGFAAAKDWSVVIPPEAWGLGLGSALAIGIVAGLAPAVRAARLTPTQALWSV